MGSRLCLSGALPARVGRRASGPLERRTLGLWPATSLAQNDGLRTTTDLRGATTLGHRMAAGSSIPSLPAAALLALRPHHLPHGLARDLGSQPQLHKRARDCYLLLRQHAPSGKLRSTGGGPCPSSRLGVRRSRSRNVKLKADNLPTRVHRPLADPHSVYEMLQGTQREPRKNERGHGHHLQNHSSLEHCSGSHVVNHELDHRGAYGGTKLAVPTTGQPAASQVNSRTCVLNVSSGELRSIAMKSKLRRTAPLPPCPCGPRRRRRRHHSPSRRRAGCRRGPGHVRGRPPS